MHETMTRLLQNIRRHGGGHDEAAVLTWALGVKAHEFAGALSRVAAGKASHTDADRMEAAIA